MKDNIPEVEATAEEREAIRRGREQFARGEFTSYDSVDELRKELAREEAEE